MEAGISSLPPLCDGGPRGAHTQPDAHFLMCDGCVPLCGHSRLLLGRLDIFDLELTLEIGVDSTSPFSSLTSSLIHSTQGNGPISTLPLGLSLSVCTIGMEAWLLHPERPKASQNGPTLTVAGVCISSVDARGSWRGN